jgi:spore coat polysaccharide biosynthesis protein SpsF
LRIGFLLTARLGSLRLPRKHLLEVNGNALLEILARRIREAFHSDFSGGARLVIATSDELANREFERFNKLGIHVFYGPKQNIPLRHLQAARALELDAIIAIDGDDVLCSVAAMQAVRDGLAQDEDYANTSGLPLGMNAFGYRCDFLSAALSGNEERTLETGWGHIFDAGRLVSHHMHLRGQIPDDLRFTLDYPEDYAFFQAVIERFGDRIFTASDQNIVDYVVAHGLNKITQPISERYWQDFQAARDAEKLRDATCSHSKRSI